jgi:large subunit ribosomal protein L18
VERPKGHASPVHFSAHHVYAQVIDDDAGKTLAAVSTLQKDLAGKKAAANRESADSVSARRSQRSCWRKR